MFSRLILKSLLIIGAVATVMGSFAQAQEQAQLSLEQIHGLAMPTYARLNDPQYSNTQKLNAILRQKFVAETSVRQLILDGKVEPTDVAKPKSALAQAFKVVDNLAVLAQLKLDENGRFTENSCIEAKSMLNLTETNINTGKIHLGSLETQTMATLNNLCK